MTQLRTSTSPCIDERLARSWLLVNSARPDAHDIPPGADPDVVVFDLEDAVAPHAKDSARDRLVSWLAGTRAWVRINDRTTTHWAKDIEYLSGLDGLAGVILAKTESVRDVADTAAGLGPATPIVALIESARGIENATDIAAEPHTTRLAFGSGDYRRDVGVADTDEALAYPRSRLVVASRAAGLPGPIDGPTLSPDDDTVIARVGTGASLGMTGKLCLQPMHAPLINAAMSPSPEAVAEARDFLAAHALRGGVIRDGSDTPRLATARKIDALAVTFGIEPALTSRSL
ncbi:HpcH/HpaI aldolase/citrate lyase family protein [Gordonia sp. NPDC003376]